MVALVAGLVATMLSMIIGVSAGYLGGVTDDGLSLLSNVFLAIPGLPLLIVIDSYLPVASRSNSLVIGLVIALTGWAWGARVLRAQTMSLRNRDFIEASTNHRREPVSHHVRRSRAESAASAWPRRCCSPSSIPSGPT